MKSRTRARSVALQVLYEIDMTGHLPGEVFTTRLMNAREDDQFVLNDDLENFAHQLVFGIFPQVDKLDRAIEKYAPDWPFDQIAAIDRNIMRMACWEFAVSRITPTKVAINEAVELAKMFGSDNAPRFINGVLGSLANHENDIYQSFMTAAK